MSTMLNVLLHSGHQVETESCSVDAGVDTISSCVVGLATDDLTVTSSVERTENSKRDTECSIGLEELLAHEHARQWKCAILDNSGLQF